MPIPGMITVQNSNICPNTMVVSVDDKARLLRNKGDTTEAVDDAKSVVVVVLGKSMADGECIMGKAKAREERCIIMTLLMKSERSGCLPELCWYGTTTNLPPYHHTFSWKKRGCKCDCPWEARKSHTRVRTTYTKYEWCDFLYTNFYSNV